MSGPADGALDPLPYPLAGQPDEARAGRATQTGEKVPFPAACAELAA